MYAAPALRLVAPLVLLAACSSGPRVTASSTTGAGGADAGTGGGGAGGGFTCNGTGVSKGPWSFAVGVSSAKLRWETCRDGVEPDVTYVPEAGGSVKAATSAQTKWVLTNTYKAALNPLAEPDWAGTWYMHEAVLTGLSPATCYTYQLVADATRKGRFCTSRPTGSPLTFWSVGDTNPGIGPYAAGDIAQILPYNPDFTLHGGDIQYYDSFLETWASWFPVMEPMLAQGAFFPAVGNHESETPTEYADYTERFFGGAGFDGTDNYYRFDSAGVWFFSLDTELPISTGSTQGGWLVKELANAASQPGFRFSIVYLHRPLVTCGDTADDPIDRAELEPIFEQYKVPLVIQAHMHGYERFEFPNITYITSAGGGGAIGDVNANTSRAYCAQRVASGPYRFGVVFQLGAAGLSATTIEWQGTVLDTFTVAQP
jgi:acid phosphatase type 7